MIGDDLTAKPISIHDLAVKRTIFTIKFYDEYKINVRSYPVQNATLRQYIPHLGE